MAAQNEVNGLHKGNFTNSETCGVFDLPENLLHVLMMHNEYGPL
jgi:hypothetical protein